MMYNWLTEPIHNVRNFNLIFNMSKLNGFDLEEPVTLGEIHLGELREVFVKGAMYLIQLKSTPSLNGEIGDIPLGKSEQLVLDYIDKKEPLLGRNQICIDLNLSKRVIDMSAKSLETKGYISFSSMKNTNIKIITRRR